MVQALPASRTTLLTGGSWRRKCPRLARTLLISQSEQQAESPQEPQNKAHTIGLIDFPLKSFLVYRFLVHIVRPKYSHSSHAYHSCLGLVQSCLWTCLSTNWYRSAERRVKLSGTNSSLHSSLLKPLDSRSVADLQSVH